MDNNQKIINNHSPPCGKLNVFIIRGRLHGYKQQVVFPRHLLLFTV
jgi:hypothetical protein